MTRQVEQSTDRSIFEYLYRDAGNFKTYGMLLLAGAPTDEAISKLANSLESDQCFVAEQVGVPSLCPQHFEDCESYGPTDMDHAYHEFHALRAATPEDLETLTVFSTLDDLVAKFVATEGVWNVMLSPNARW